MGKSSQPATAHQKKELVVYLYAADVLLVQSNSGK